MCKKGRARRFWTGRAARRQPHPAAALPAYPAFICAAFGAAAAPAVSKRAHLSRRRQSCCQKIAAERYFSSPRCAPPFLISGPCPRFSGGSIRKQSRPFYWSAASAASEKLAFHQGVLHFSSLRLWPPSECSVDRILFGIFVFLSHHRFNGVFIIAGGRRPVNTAAAHRRPAALCAAGRKKAYPKRGARYLALFLCQGGGNGVGQGVQLALVLGLHRGGDGHLLV